jgi:predicted ester cyclase
VTNRKLLDRYFEIVDGKQYDKFAEVDSGDLVLKTPMGTLRGVEGHQGMTRGFAAAFPNFKHSITQAIESGDRIACEGKFTGDHTGPMMLPNGQSIPASGRSIAFDWSAHARVKDGKVIELSVYFDTTSLMAQIS